jgi:hypothetical protein
MSETRQTLSGRPWVYVAGPYTVGRLTVNIRKAIAAAEQILEAGGYPLIPHLDFLWDIVNPKGDWWYDYTLELMRRCDIVYRLPGVSAGADGEEEEARRLGIPITHSISGFRIWKEAVYETR